MLIEELITYAKIKQLEDEETDSHFANNFTILEPNAYDDDELLFKKELKQHAHGWRIIHI